LCAIPAALSHALCREQGWYAGCQHPERSPADVSCLQQAEAACMGMAWKSGQMVSPFAMSWGWQGCSQRENDDSGLFSEAGCRR